MNKDITFEKKIINPAIKAAKKYRKKHHSTPDISNIGHLKIQTANVFARILSGIIGFILVVGGIYLFLDEFVISSFMLLIIGCLLVVLGIRGRKRELQSVINTINIVDGIGMVIDALSEIDL